MGIFVSRAVRVLKVADAGLEVLPRFLSRLDVFGVCPLCGGRSLGRGWPAGGRSRLRIGTRDAEQHRGQHQKKDRGPRRVSCSHGASLRAGSKIFNLADTSVEVGEVTSVSRSAQGTKALAMVRKIHAKEGLEVKLEDNARGKLTRIAPYVSDL